MNSMTAWFVQETSKCRNKSDQLSQGKLMKGSNHIVSLSNKANSALSWPYFSARSKVLKHSAINYPTRHQRTNMYLRNPWGRTKLCQLRK